MNKVCLIGRLTKDVETRYTQNQTPVSTFTLAVNRPFAKAEPKADFITIQAWGKTAEFCDKYLKKGQQVGITGKIETSSFDDKDSKKVYTTKVIAEEIFFADGKKEETTPDIQDTLPF